VTAEPRKILIVLHGSIGDVARALPLVNLLRDRFPRAHIAWSVEPPAFPLVETHPAVDEAILFDRPHWQSELFKFLRRVRAARFDWVLDLQRVLKSGIVSWWSGAPHRLGFNAEDAKEFNWIFNNHHIPPVEGGVSKLVHYLKFAAYLGAPTEPVRWEIRLTAADRAGVERLLQGVRPRFAAFYVGSRWASKQWFPRQTALSAAELERRYGLDIVLLGGREDARFAREVEESGLVRVANRVGRTSLREAVGVLARAAVAVGPDSGLMHLCAAVGTPVVSLWGATDPAWSGPHGYERFAIRGRAPCSPCYRRSCPIGKVCMESIGIDEVATAAGAALEEGERKRAARG
jgi:heptosyltransferase-1